MNGRISVDYVSAVVVAVLLVLTAWGNAIALLLASLAILVAWIVVNPKDLLRRGAAPATAAAAIAAVIAIVMILR
jgi:hypothetical protein